MDSARTSLDEELHTLRKALTKRLEQNRAHKFFSEEGSHSQTSSKEEGQSSEQRNVIAKNDSSGGSWFSRLLQLVALKEE